MGKKPRWDFRRLGCPRINTKAQNAYPEPIWHTKTLLLTWQEPGRLRPGRPGKGPRKRLPSLLIRIFVKQNRKEANDSKRRMMKPSTNTAPPLDESALCGCGFWDPDDDLLHSARLVCCSRLRSVDETHVQPRVQLHCSLQTWRDVSHVMCISSQSLSGGANFSSKVQAQKMRASLRILVCCLFVYWETITPSMKYLSVVQRKGERRLQGERK